MWCAAVAGDGGWTRRCVGAVGAVLARRTSRANTAHRSRSLRWICRRESDLVRVRVRVKGER